MPTGLSTRIVDQLTGLSRQALIERGEPGIRPVRVTATDDVRQRLVLVTGYWVSVLSTVNSSITSNTSKFCFNRAILKQPLDHRLSLTAWAAHYAKHIRQRSPAVRRDCVEHHLPQRLVLPAVLVTPLNAQLSRDLATLSARRVDPSEGLARWRRSRLAPLDVLRGLLVHPLPCQG